MDELIKIRESAEVLRGYGAHPKQKKAMRTRTDCMTMRISKGWSKS